MAVQHNGRKEEDHQRGHELEGTLLVRNSHRPEFCAGCGSRLISSAQGDRQGEVASQLDESADERELHERALELRATPAAAAQMETVVVFAVVALQNVASGLNEQTYGREWALFFIAPLVVVLAFLCAIVARSAPSR